MKQPPSFLTTRAKPGAIRNPETLAIVILSAKPGESAFLDAKQQILRGVYPELRRRVQADKATA